jgi:Tol biopolymer transport system component
MLIFFDQSRRRFLVRLLCRLAPATLLIACALAADPIPFTAAYIHPGDGGLKLTLFPLVGAEITAPAPSGVPSFGLPVFGPDGRTIYFASDGLWRLELKAHRQSIVRGSSGLTTMWHLTVSRPSGRIFVSGVVKTLAGVECGTYEIDPDGETPRRLLARAASDCGGGGGEVSPDGKSVLGHSGEFLCITDLATRSARIMKGFAKGSVAAWSPDGKSISVIRDGRIILVDPDTLKLRNIGGGGNLTINWAPDATKILARKSQLSCMPYLYFESLAVIDLQTGRESIIKSSHCNVSGGFFGWIDPETVR